jgi:DNA-binding NarL/FixJ family response regulator
VSVASAHQSLTPQRLRQPSRPNGLVCPPNLRRPPRSAPRSGPTFSGRTNYGLDQHVYTALRAGASGFLVKDTEPADLLHGIRVAARGDALLSPTITRRLIGEYLSRPSDTSLATGLDALTNREREVVALAARGLSNDEIATRMVISPTTAKTHISRAMTKLHARDRAQLVVLAYESGLVTPRNAPPR